MEYKQGLNCAFVDRLNNLHSIPGGEWWRKMLDDPELFVAIRNNYLNVYYRGCSLAKLMLVDGEVVAETHYKYLLKPTVSKPYVRSLAGEFQLTDHWPSGLAGPFTSHLSNLSALKSAAKVYAGGEKKFVGEVIKKNRNVVDVEIALTKDAVDATADQESKSARAKRIDIVALRWEGSNPTLDFYEVKLFSNNDIRATNVAKVIKQITGYEELLEKYEVQIRDGFRRSCDNLVELDGIRPERKSWAQTVRDNQDRLTINTKPFLVIGEYDGDQKVGKVWKVHRDKLSHSLGAKRLLLGGSPKSITLKYGHAPDGAAAK